MPRVPYTKPALDYSAQLKQLKDRGLIIENDAKALHLLEHLSYYRLSGYWYPMLSFPKTSHNFKPNSTFTNAFKMYCFDRELKSLIMTEIEKIEVAVRAKMIHIMSMRQGPFWYLNSALFIDRSKLATSLNNLRREFTRSDETFIKTFKGKYLDPLPPSWMILEVTSFGTLSNLYSNLQPGLDKRDIANYFGVDDSTFQSWLHSFTYVRNVCAHHSRLWNKQMSISPQVPLTPTYPFISITTVPNRISGQPPMLNNNKVYFLLCILIYLLNTINPNHTFKQKLYILLKKYPMIHLPAMGFPQGWENEEIWKWDEVKSSQKWYKKVLKYLKDKASH
jgi:abortive infection bacteriophage resistance protein